MPDPLVLALDFGGTKLSAAVCAVGASEWRSIERLPSPPDKDARYDLETMLTLSRRVLGANPPAYIGVSFGGPVDARAGRVILSHHVPGWEDIPLRDYVQDIFHVPVSVDNDANVAALGEYRFGAGAHRVAGRPSSLLYITVSTGVGGGLIVDGKIYHGADSTAGEIGHTIVDPRGPECICGRHGCVEIMACGPAIARAARARLIAEPHGGAILRSLVENRLDALTAERVACAAQQEDGLAQTVLDKAAFALGFGIGTAITLLNPECIVLGGGVAKSGEKYMERVREAARGNSLPQMRVDIVPATLGDDAPLWGAVALAQSKDEG